MSENMDQHPLSSLEFTHAECTELLAGMDENIISHVNQLLLKANLALRNKDLQKIDELKMIFFLLAKLNSDQSERLGKICHDFMNKADLFRESLSDKPTGIPNLAHTVTTNIKEIATRATLHPLPKTHNEHASY